LQWFYAVLLVFQQSRHFDFVRPTPSPNMTYYQQHREEILAKARAARAADPEKFRAYQQRRRAANPEANRRACAAWARQNPGKVLARVKRWQRLNPERLKEQRQRANATRRARRRAAKQTTPALPGLALGEA
jgi:hypothetical protein